MNQQSTFKWAEQSLRYAFQGIAARGSRGGIDRVTAEAYSKNLNGNLSALLKRLQEGAYVPSPYEKISIPKDGGSVRVLSLATVEDKIVQSIVMHYLDDNFKGVFLDCSYAYRENKGHKKAIGRVEHSLKAARSVMTADVDNFFDSIDHSILESQLAERIKDDRLLTLIRLWITTDSIHDSRLQKRNIGIPQGGPVSPILSNIYLSPFDRFMVGLGRAYIRYADNFIVFSENKNELVEIFNRAVDYLGRNLKLRLNEATPVIRTEEEGFDFLGIHFQNGKRTIADSMFTKALKEPDELRRRHRKDSLERLRDHWNKMVQSWRFYYGPYDVAEQFSSLRQELQKNLRQEILYRAQHEEIPEAKLGEIICSFDSLTANPNENRDFAGRILGEIKEFRKGRADGKEAQIARTRAAKVRKFIHLHVAEHNLLVSTPGFFIGRSQGKIQVRKGQEVVTEQPLRSIHNLMLSDHGIGISTDVIAECVEKKTQIFIVDSIGHYRALIIGDPWPQFSITLSQVNAASSWLGSQCAFNFVDAKIRNQVNLLRYYAKYHYDANRNYAEVISKEIPRMEKVLTDISALNRKGSLPGEYNSAVFGLEGQAAISYWACIAALIGDEWAFTKREHQNAANIVNKMLNYGYGVLSSKTLIAIISSGLNPMISFLHTAQEGRPSLVFDVMEQFRPTCVDRVVVSMLLRKERVEKDGEKLPIELRKRIASGVLTKMGTEFQYRGKRQTIEEILAKQLDDVVEFLQGKTRNFRAFLSRW